MFEGLGVGSRLALMKLPPKYNYIPFLGALLYAITTPIGIAAGLGIRTTYNPGSTRASIVSGILDSLSSGILLYTGLVEVGDVFVDDVTPIDDLAAPSTRIPFQRRDPHCLQWQIDIRHHLHVTRLWDHVTSWSLGVNNDAST
jgi:hypothetical protein